MRVGVEEVMKCPYCGEEVILRKSNYVYNNNKYLGYMWVCADFPKCDSYVGCHPNTTRPLGVIADRNLRRLKTLAHRSFDPIWKGGDMNRRQAYTWLSKQLGIETKDCHIGMFNENLCKRTIEVCHNYFNNTGKSFKCTHKRPYGRDLVLPTRK